jgi:prevent-host-death family protein
VCDNASVQTLPLTEAKAHLSSLADQVATTHERVAITRHGHPHVVLVAAEDLDAMEATMSLLSNPDALRELAEADADIAAGRTASSQEIAGLLARRAERVAQ